MSFDDSQGWRFAGRLLLAALVIAFALAGFHGFRRTRSHRIDGAGPLSSSDSLLLQATQVHGSAGKILDSLAGLPPAAPLAVVVPKGNAFGSLLLQSISEITWPHDVYMVQIGKDDFLQKIDVLRKYHFGAAIYYGIAPPAAGSDARHIGPLTVAPVPQ